MLKKLKAWLIRKLGGYCAPVKPIQVECAVEIKGIAKALKTLRDDRDGYLGSIERILVDELSRGLIYEGRVAYRWARTDNPNVEKLIACVWALPPEGMM